MRKKATASSLSSSGRGRRTGWLIQPLTGSSLVLALLSQTALVLVTASPFWSWSGEKGGHLCDKLSACSLESAFSNPGTGRTTLLLPTPNAPSASLESLEQALTQGELDLVIIASNWPSHTIAVYSCKEFQREMPSIPFLPLKPESFPA